MTTFLSGRRRAAKMAVARPAAPPPTTMTSAVSMNLKLLLQVNVGLVLFGPVLLGWLVSFVLDRAR
jgi:hypothetical protein